MTLKELEAENEKLRADLKAAQEHLGASEKTVSGLEAEKKTLTEANAKLTEDALKFSEREAASNQAIVAIKADNDKLKAEAKSASQRAQEILAEVHHKSLQDDGKRPDEESAIDPNVKGVNRVAAALKRQFP